MDKGSISAGLLSKCFGKALLLHGVCNQLLVTKQSVNDLCRNGKPHVSKHGFHLSALHHLHLAHRATFPSPQNKLVRTKAGRKDRQTERDTTAAFKIVAVKDLSEGLKGQHSVLDRMSYSG